MLRVGGLCVHFSSSSHPSLFCLLPPFFTFPSCFFASLLFLFILSPSPHPAFLLLSSFSFPLQAEDDVVLLAAIPLAVLDSTLCWWISAAAPSPLFSESLAFSPFLFLSCSYLCSAGRECMLAEWDRVKVLNCPACEVNVA